MTAPLSGRDLLYNEYINNKENCRQAVRAIQNQATSVTVTDTKELPKIRYGFATKLAQDLFGVDKNKQEAFKEFLKQKLKNNPSSLPMPESWAKLFDKIVDPAKVMKNDSAKDFTIILALWQTKEDQLNQAFAQHNREIATLDFNQLAAEIDQQASNVSNFKDALRNWARNTSNQPGGPRLQELCAIPNFAKDFIAWQKELLEELRKTLDTRANPALKTQVCSLNEKLVAFIQAINFIPNQQPNMQQLTILHRSSEPKFGIPVSSLSLSTQDRNDLLSNEAQKYANVVRLLANHRQAHVPPAQAAVAAPVRAVNPAPQPQPVLANVAARPQQVQAPALDLVPPIPLQPALPVAPAKAPATPAQNNVQRSKAPAQSKQGFLKKSAIFLFKLLTFPFWVLKWLFTSNKK